MLDYAIWPEHKLIVMWNRGGTPVADFLGRVRSLHRDPEFSVEYDILIDVTEQKQHYTPNEIRQLTVSLDLDRPVRNAIVAPENISYGLGRMYEMQAESVGRMRIAVFRQRSEALAWLGLDASLVQRLEGANAADRCTSPLPTAPNGLATGPDRHSAS